MKQNIEINASTDHGAKRQLKTLFVVATGIVLLVAMAIVTSLEFIVASANLVPEAELEGSWVFTTIMFGVASIVIGLFLSFLTGKVFLAPMNRVLDGMQELSNGNYNTRIDFGENKTMSIVSDNFNTLAEELQNTEILRSDFINNFSHEFKTPIASIKGLVSLMKSGKVTPEKQAEYLRIIEEETDRLSMMTTNVLNLSKIEKQGILTEKSHYNLSEQIRSSVLLFERQWKEKRLTLSMDFDEYTVFANEDLMKQVWINLVDNAVKFSAVGGELSIDIIKTDLALAISVGNTGDTIPSEALEKIFNKFYQATSSHSRPGNGIGLSIVKSIVELHGGNVGVRSQEGKTVFTVTLPTA